MSIFKSSDRSKDGNKAKQPAKEQILVYIKKYLRFFFRSGGWINIIMAFVIGIIVSCVTADDMFYAYSSTRSGLFVLVCACIWVGLFNSIQTICMERASIRHDHNSLGVPYYVMMTAHLICDLILCFCECLILLAPTLIRHHARIVVTGTNHFNIIGVILLFLVMLVVACGSDALGLMVSAFVRTPGQASTAMPFILIMQFIISGFVFQLKGFFAKISNLTIAKWGMQAACIALDVNTLSTDTEALTNASKEQMDIINRYLEYQKSEYIMAYNPGNFHFLKSMLVLLLFIIVEIGLTWLAMKLMDFDKR